MLMYKNTAISLEILFASFNNHPVCQQTATYVMRVIQYFKFYLATVSQLCEPNELIMSNLYLVLFRLCKL